MSKRRDLPAAAWPQRVVAAMHLYDYENRRSDVAGQQALFDAPLPQRHAAPAPDVSIYAGGDVATPDHIDFLKRVLVAKYLRRILKCSYRQIGVLLHCDRGTACRLDHYKLSQGVESALEPADPATVIDEPGMRERSSPAARDGHDFTA